MTFTSSFQSTVTLSRPVLSVVSDWTMWVLAGIGVRVFSTVSRVQAPGAGPAGFEQPDTGPRATAHSGASTSGRSHERAMGLLPSGVEGQEDPQPCVALVYVAEARRRVVAVALEHEEVAGEAEPGDDRDEAPQESVLDVVVGIGPQGGLALAVDRAVGDVDPLEAIVGGHERPPRHEQVRQEVRAHAGP